jgi:hypothetical protein
MENIYKGKILSTSHEHFQKYVTVGFFPSEGDVKGLFINIDYNFEDDIKARFFVKNIEDRLNAPKQDKSIKGINAEVSIKESLNRNITQYDSNGPIRFLDDL